MTSSRPSPTTSGGAPLGNASPRVLLIEDEADIAGGVQRTLENLGCRVEWEADGTAGLRSATDNAFDLVIVDLLLPGLNGFRIVSQLRAADVWCPILVLTAKSGEWDEAESLDSGADDFLMKPVSTTVLVAHVRALLRRTRLGGLRDLQVGSLTLDLVRHRCRVGEDTQVQLSARETEVLAHLMLHPDEVVTKDDLMEAVWGPTFAGKRNIVEVYVRHLRHKLDDGRGDVMIETVWGSGYRLNRRA